MITLSVAIVVHKPDLQVLRRVFETLRIALIAGAEARLFDGSVMILDNSLDSRVTESVRAEAAAALAGVSSRVEALAENRGFGHGHNAALRYGIAEHYHVVMNPDLYLDPDALVQAVRRMEAEPTIGLLVADVRGEDGERHHLCKRNPTFFDMMLRGFAPVWLRRIFADRMARMEMRDRDYDREIPDVEYPTGCFMFFRSSDFKAVRGFDERYFMYVEDADIGRRIRQRASVLYAPSVRVVHRWARGTHRSWKLRLTTIRSVLIYSWTWGEWW
ncbi:MAG: hypothetical protein IT357_16480 [Gemmatimonadaceae bacterium]|nr:hypothetical protein [Gemmatimonadaceae bacterium]